jgi:hypothetical protein
MIRIDDFQPMLLDERPLDLDEPGWIYASRRPMAPLRMSFS